LKTLLIIFCLTFILNGTEEKIIFDKWIDIPSGNSIQKIKKEFFTTIKSDLKSNYDKADFIGIVKIKKLKINKYNKKDSGKIVTYLAEIKKTYKGSYKKEDIKFNIGLEVEESIYTPQNEELLILLYKDEGILYIDKFLILPPQKYFLDFLEKYASLKLNENSTEKLYWENVAYDKWAKVPLNNEPRENNFSSSPSSNDIERIISSLHISLYSDADFVGILSAKKYKKIPCDIESATCGKYKAKVLTSFKGKIKDEFIVFIDDLGNKPDVYGNKAIYFLYKKNNVYYQDEFFQVVATEEWINFFGKLSKNKVVINNSIYKSLYSFCKATSIKESEIRALNPWINKKATNIPPNAEIIIPNLSKEDNNESK